VLIHSLIENSFVDRGGNDIGLHFEYYAIESSAFDRHMLSRYRKAKNI
jgi:hypothetical protein